MPLSFSRSLFCCILISMVVPLSCMGQTLATPMIYWPDVGPQSRDPKIQRSNLDGSGVEDLGINGLEHPFRIAVDAIGEKIYWTDRYTNKIQRANLDGSDVEDLITTGLYDPFGIALDTASGKMYWTDQSYHQIKRANFAGSEVEELVYLGVERVPCGIALAIPKPAIEAAIDMDPNTLNLKSKGKWVTCYICLPEDYDVADVNCYSIVLEGEIEAKWIWVEDQEQVVIAKFRRSEIQEMLAASDQLGELELTISGELIDGTRFEGTDTIKVIDEGNKK